MLNFIDKLEQMISWGCLGLCQQAVLCISKQCGSRAAHWGIENLVL